MRATEAFINIAHRTSNLHHHSIRKSSYPSHVAIHHVINPDHSSEVITSSAPTATQITDGVLSNEDIAIGALIAVALAFLFSFLNGRAPSSSDLILWRNNQNKQREKLNEDLEINSENVFDAKSWKEMSRPENYAVYSKNKVISQIDAKENNLNAEDNKTLITPKESSKGGKNSIENRLVLLSLLILFVPIFSVEFFFALSRQFICGDYLTNVDDTLWMIDAKKAASATSGSSPWAAQLCSPVIMSK